MNCSIVAKEYVMIKAYSRIEKIICYISKLKERNCMFVSVDDKR